MTIFGGDTANNLFLKSNWMHQNLYLHLLLNQCTSMLTDIWYKDALLIKRRTCEMFGHGFIIVNSQVVASVEESSQSPFFFFSQTRIHIDPYRFIKMHWMVINSVITLVSCCVSPPVPLLCYLCLLSTQMGNNKCWTTTLNHIYLLKLKRKCLFLYIFMRTSTPLTNKQTTARSY